MSQEAFRIIPEKSFVKELVIDLDEAVAIVKMETQKGIKKYTYFINTDSEHFDAFVEGMNNLNPEAGVGRFCTTFRNNGVLIESSSEFC
jgi:hypothetical protein